jgi:hypothetical protein
MAELTVLDEKLGEVLGLAELLQRMGDEAAQIEQRCDVASSARDGMRTAIVKVVTFALPLQRRHVDAVREQSLRLAGDEDPREAA